MRWVTFLILSVLGLSTPARSATDLLQNYSREESCEILKQTSFVSPAGLQKLSEFQGPGFAVRVLAKPRTQPFETYDVAILVGELHVKPCEDAARGSEFLKEFRHFAFELFMAPAHEAGVALPQGYGPAGSNFDEIREAYGLCGSLITDAGEEVVFRSAGQKKLYLLEGEDFDHPLNWRERLDVAREKAIMDTALFLAKTLHWKPGSPSYPDNYREEIVRQSARVPEQVAEWEALQRASIERHGKIQPRFANVDVRNKIMAQNIGVILSKRYRNQSADILQWSEPVVALMGSGHITGVKHQLMLYQKFKEIPLEHIERCARQ